jgi:hypothetical protein
MFYRARRLTLLVLGLVAAGLVTGVDAREGGPAAPAAGSPTENKATPPKSKWLTPPPSTEQLNKWVDELDSDEFVVRETATENLFLSGPAAIGVLRKALVDGGSLEATTRSLHIVQQLALADVDFDSQEAARDLLEETASRTDTATGRRAASALATLNEKSGAFALKELEGLGANINCTQIIDGFGNVQEIVDAIEIGSNWKGDDRDLRRLKRLQPINRLVLVGDKVGDEALVHVAKMQQLTSLHAHHANITDAGLKALAGMERLQELGIYYVPVSDDALAALRGNKSLISLRLYGTKATRKGVDELQAVLGLAKVDFRNGAFLGVGCETVNGQCVISNVHPESPADKAGVRDQDTLVSFDGKKIADFTELTACISEYKAGDTVEVELQRLVLTEDNDAVQKTITTKVTLGEWDVGIFIRGRLAP